MWLKGAIVDVGLDAASVDVLCMVLNLDNDKTVSTNQLQHWRKGLFNTAQHKSGKPRLLLSYSDGRTKVSRPDHLRGPVKLNLRTEELASVMSGKSSADSGPPCTMAQLMLAHRKVS